MKNAKTLSKGLHAVGMVAIIFALSFMMVNVADALTITKTVDETEAYPGDIITYTIKVTNDTSEDECGGTNLIITDNLAKVLPNAELQSLSISEWGTPSYNVVKLTHEIAPGSDEIFTLTVKVKDDALIGAKLINNAWVRCELNDAISANSDDVKTTIIAPPPVPAPILNVIKSVDKTLANLSDTLTYTVTISNTGDADATYIELVDTLPAGLTFTDMSFDDTTVHTWNYKTKPILKTLKAGDTADFTYDVRIDSSAGVGTYTNTAIATSYDSYDENKVAIATSKPATASTDVRIPVVLGDEAPSLTITKTVNKDYTNPGGTATYTVIVTNDGDAPALNATLDDVLPTGFVFADTGNTTATWDLADIVPTESVTTTYDVKIDASILAGKYVNTATVSADDVDGVSAKADLEVKEVLVLGAEEVVVLPTTGGGLAIIALSGLMLIGTGIFVRRKIK